MAKSNQSGRTPSDAVVEVLSTSRLFLLVVGLFLMLFFVVHFSAEPGSTVEFFGIVKYQKGKKSTETPKVRPTDESDSYILPQNIQLTPKQKQGIPILDGTLSILSDRNIGGKIVGPSIGKIKVASRSIDGTPNGLTRPYKDNETILFSPDTYTEIEYRGRVFAMAAKSLSPSSFSISISKTPRATLDLVLVKDLPVPDGGE